MEVMSFFLFAYHFSKIIFCKKKNKLSMLFSVVLFLLIIFSFSRATWLAFLIIIIFISVIKVKNRKLLFFIFLTGFIVLIKFLGPALLTYKKNTYQHRLGSLLSISKYEKYPTIVGRMIRWKNAIQIAKDFPITGSGIGTYLRLEPTYLKFLDIKKTWKKRKRQLKQDNVHNYYLQLLSEIGIVGMFFFRCYYDCYTKKSDKAYFD